MKRAITSIFVSLMLSVTALAQPLLVGHRGSYWGVENTSEAFINGAKKGYQYLETDVKVAGDGTFVLSHDDTTERLGGTLTIASATIDQLKAETYTQTRGGVTYTATICTLDEYLDICAEYKVTPVIELKWATGINNNDCSNIPGLIAAIEAKGFRNNCVILTSMKPCLEYIDDNYPDVKLQFLTGQYWASHFDWCVERGIDADIQVGYFDKSTVTQFHDAGLKVNCWTVNDNAAYKTYGNYGCDFITTDYIDPTGLPDLDASVTFPPNTIDYPNADGTVQGSYTPEFVANTEAGEPAENEMIHRALVRDGKWYVLSSVAGVDPKISIYDAETGELTKTLDMTGVSGGTIALNDIAFTADGVLLGCNLSTVPYAGGGDTWKIYKWTSDDAAPAVFSEVTAATMLGNWTSAVAGVSFAVSGKLDDLYVYTATYSATVETRTYRIAGIQFSSGVAGTAVYALNNNYYTEAAWGKTPVLQVTPSSRNNLLVDSEIMQPKEYTFEWEGTRLPMNDYASTPSGLLSDKAQGLSFLRFSSKVYAYAANIADDGTLSAAMYNVTDSIINMSAVSPAVPDGILPKGYYTTGIELADGHINLYMYLQGGGFYKYAIEVEGGETAPSADADFALELLWQNSTTTSNAPEHIDGTNAQQGGAANGLFYVNDCADELIYIFDSTGCLGSIPGGAGWGCALDDAGNIIVRDDKNTDTSHSFLIYPAGATVDNPGTPITLDVTVPLEGQTNFISASGNVLGESGNIYMYPNKQSAINIITMSHGEVSATSASNDVAMEGTTAGYVIPINDNTENWIYQIRSTGFYTYNGGVNEILLTGRGTTTAPARNNTVGGEYFTLSGHKIFIHSSGANYKGGFTIRDLSTDEVITSVDPIGTLGYETGGNYSVANWIFAEKIDDGSYYIYQYCPANGMAVYKFYDKNYSGVEDITTGQDNTSLRVFPNPATSTISIEAPATITEIRVYSLSGHMMPIDNCEINGSTATADVSSLPAGVYILTAGNATTKLIKR